MHRGGTATVWQDEAECHVEGTMIFVQNVVSFTITAGKKRWYVVGAYVLPNHQPTVHQVDQSLACGMAGMETLLVRDLNSHLAQPQY